MKKFMMMIAVVALMATTACNEKPAKNVEGANAETEQVDGQQNDTTSKPRVGVEKAAPTQDGKDHTVAEFDTKEYQIKLENLADGTYRLTMNGKNGKANQVVETKQCVLQEGNYLMKTDDGKIYIIKTDGKTGELTVMDKNDIKKYQ